VSAGELAFAVQTAKGSPAAAATRRTALSGGSYIEPAKGVRLGDEVSTSRAPIALSPYVGSVPTLGDPEILVRPNVIGLLLYAALGGKAVSGSADPWTHTFTLASTLPYLTVWRHLAGLVNDRHADVRITRLVLAGRAGGPLRCTVSLVGAASAHRTAQETSVALETADVLQFHHGTGALLVEGAAVASLQEFTLSLDTGVALVEGLSGPRAVLTGKTAISVETVSELVSASLWNRMVYGTASPANLAAPTLVPLELAGSPAGLRFTFTAATSPERSLQVAVPRVVAEPSLPLPTAHLGTDRLRVRYTAIAPAAGSVISAVLRNGVSSY
jgi:hypothetical protein